MNRDDETYRQPLTHVPPPTVRWGRDWRPGRFASAVIAGIAWALAVLAGSALREAYLW